ncbi:hypothetical protein [Microbacterium jejuense]|uniref:hypothetical protein n=1 Tax=Microbacterium jejuense TaxID=1263637 RepID=UPI0031EC2124
MMGLAAVGVALMILGFTNQTPATTNGATILVFVGFVCLVAAVLRGGRHVHD